MNKSKFPSEQEINADILRRMAVHGKLKPIVELFKASLGSQLGVIDVHTLMVGDDRVSIFIFVERDDRLVLISNEQKAAVRAFFLEQVGKAIRLADGPRALMIDFDSKENVDRNYEGSYYFRMH